MRKGSALKTLVLVAVVATGAAFIVTASHEFSKDRIAANERARVLASLETVLDPRLRRRGLVPTRITATDPDLLGSDKPIDVFVVTEGGRPEAAILASVAPDGYNGPIHLLVGLSAGGTVTGVRVLSHSETPGLGDRIESGKSSWIEQFDGKSLASPPVEKWAVRKDGGDFDALTGATVTPRAVVKAVKNTLIYFSRHRDELFAEAARAEAEQRK
ncbi:MAG TPA: electron transport complex subunit RsxG [Gammaproteobacteria bacterium]|nr:electron transport complex subunit RsxG [Gammaproteobacteria bacterium]